MAQSARTPGFICRGRKASQMVQVSSDKGPLQLSPVWLHFNPNEDRLQVWQVCVCDLHEAIQMDGWRKSSSVWIPLSFLTDCWQLCLERESNSFCQNPVTQMSVRFPLGHIMLRFTYIEISFSQWNSLFLFTQNVVCKTFSKIFST